MTINRIKAVTLAVAAGSLAASAIPANAFDFAEASASRMPAIYSGNVSPAEDAWQHGKDRRKDHGWSDRRYRDGRYERAYYGEPVYRNTNVWRGRDGRYYCRKENGTTGLLIGAAVGGLVGNEVAGRGDRTLGTVLGAVGGAFLGREIDRSNSRCR
jgi:hypothetical protein